MFARMETPRSVFLFLIVLIQLFNVHQAANFNSTCRKWQKSKTIRVPKTEWRSRSNGTNGPISFTVAVHGTMSKFVNGKYICCSGYEKIKDYPFTCISTCLKYCTNGICSSPNVCECNIGYKLDLNNKYKCLPICSTPCGNGTCTAPDNCLCTEGYTFANKTCQPVCSEPCPNGVCIAPEICQCLAGYQKSGETICKPHCSSECPHGSCVGPDTCVCNSGYQMGNDNKTCQQMCSKPCLNGTCVDPETCECLVGYSTKLEKNICEPYCSGGCSHGKCVSPGTCICDPGWTRSNLNSTCVADTIYKNTGVKDWVQSNWIVLATATAISVLVLPFVIIIIMRYKRNKSHEDGGAADVPAQEFSTNVFNKAKGDYDVCNKNTVL